MPSAELEKAVNDRGISSRTMRTAKSRIGAVSYTHLYHSDNSVFSVDNTNENMPFLEKIRNTPSLFTSDNNYGQITNPLPR